MTLQEKLYALYEPFIVLECDVSHYRRINSKRFVVWAEDGEDNSFHADNLKEEQKLTGTVDLFTNKEFDPIADDIQSILNTQQIGWYLASVLYEEETNLIHYQWRWYCG